MNSSNQANSSRLLNARAVVIMALVVVLVVSGCGAESAKTESQSTAAIHATVTPKPSPTPIEMPTGQVLGSARANFPVTPNSAMWSTVLAGDDVNLSFGSCDRSSCIIGGPFPVNTASSDGIARVTNIDALYLASPEFPVGYGPIPTLPSMLEQAQAFFPPDAKFVSVASNQPDDVQKIYRSALLANAFTAASFTNDNIQSNGTTSLVAPGTFEFDESYDRTAQTFNWSIEIGIPCHGLAGCLGISPTPYNTSFASETAKGPIGA